MKIKNRILVKPRAIWSGLMALVLSANFAVAVETGMTAAEFEAYVEGRTIYYSGSTGFYGTEQYLPGRRVIWSVSENECLEGKWYQNDAGQICFVYDTLSPEPKCWRFWEDDGVLFARFANQPLGVQIHETGQSNTPLSCQGPAVGA